MTIKQTSTSSSDRLPVGTLTGETVGGGLLALLGTIHLFGVRPGGTIGVLMLLFAWPVVGGAAAAYLDRTGRTAQSIEYPLVGVLAGAMGAIVTAAIVLLSGVLGMWSSYIFSVFGSGVVAVSVAATILLTICWSVSSLVGYSIVRAVVS